MRPALLRAFLPALLLPLAAAAQQPPPSGGDWFGWKTMTGDWGGVRPELKIEGLTLGGHYVSEISGNPVGGAERGGAYAHEFQVSIDAQSKLFGWEDGVFHLILTERAGSSLSKDKIHNILTVQEIYGDGQTVRVTQLAYEHTLFGGAVDVEAGRINTENDFASSPVYFGDALWCNFQSNAICGTPIAAPVNTTGYVAYPASAWGARVKTYPARDLYIEAGAYEVNPTLLLATNGWKFGTSGARGVATFVEIGRTIGDAPGGWLGNYRVGVYYDNSDNRTAISQVTRYVPANAPALQSLPFVLRAGRYGGWAIADQTIEKDAGGGVALFGALEYGDKATAFLDWYGEAGLVRHGTFRGRTNDTAALGLAIASINGSIGAALQNLQRAGYRVPATSQEFVAEANYGVAAAPWLNVRPGLQYVWHPGGTNRFHNALVLDLKTVASF